jgi:hypothetical protein
MLLMSITLCSSTKEVQTITKPVHQTKPVIPGWVSVDFVIDSEYISKHRGNLAENYDEFVGDLFDNGLNLKNTGWLKPTYGNQNLLWTTDSELGNHRQQMLLKSTEEFKSDALELINDTIQITKVNWYYVGLIDKIRGVGSASFQSYVFVCKGSSFEASVFYWGDGLNIQPHKNKCVIELLTKLSSQ